VCSHATVQESRACSCTGYGFGDLMCRCGRKKSQHVDGTGVCTDPSARCHEFVLTLPDDPRPVTDMDIQVAALALEGLLSQCPGSTVEDLARTALLAAAGSQYAREWEVAALRRSRDAYRDQVTWMTQHLQRLGMTLDDQSAGGTVQDRGA
jgi:hypothetical protein